MARRPLCSTSSNLTSHKAAAAKWSLLWRKLRIKVTVNVQRLFSTQFEHVDVFGSFSAISHFKLAVRLEPWDTSHLFKPLHIRAVCHTDSVQTQTV